MQPLAQGPVSLDWLELHNIRCFEDFRLEFGTGRDPADRWSVILGDNGVGKSTILRTIALAVVGERTAGSLLDREGRSSGLVRWGAEDGEGEVELAAGDRNGHFHVGEYQWLKYHTDPLEFPVFGYGTGRGSALGGPERSVSMGPLDAVGTLFSADAQMVHAETWLRSLELRALQSSGGGEEQFREAVHDTLKLLLPGVETIEVTSDDVILVGEGVGRANLNALSDGYGSTAGWILDLIARWSDLARNQSAELDGDFARRMTGLLLVDELDLHLHPKWQMEVIKAIRGVFQELTVVATTHNPLTLHGCHEGEIHVLSREDDVIESRQVNLQPGLGVDQILTGAWFGLSSTLDAGTNQLLQDYQKLLRAGGSDKDKRELEHEIRSRLGSFAETEEERLALELVAEATESRPAGELTDEETQELRRQMQDLFSSES